MRILFVASLHHPQTLTQERREHPAQLFPSSTSLHFWERALRARGHELAIFYRNLSGFSDGRIESLQDERYTDHLTPRKIASALMRRLPPNLNPDLQRRNARLLQEARAFQPDLLWLNGDNTIITAETLARIKSETHCRILYSTGTSPIVFSHAIERAAAPLYDLVIVNDYYHGIQWRELGAPDMLCLPIAAIDPDFHRPQPVDDYAGDVNFVGTLLPATLYSERVEALQAIADFEPALYSVHEIPPQLRPLYRGSALGRTMLQVLSSAKITLNMHGNFMRYGGNMRLFEASAVATLQITDDRPGVHEWFTEGENIVVFRDHDDLREKIAHYLAHDDERHRLAQAAREHVLAHHTYAQRLDQLERHGIIRPSSAT